MPLDKFTKMKPLLPDKPEVDISVIVPAYNQERFIGRCLRSLLHQTMPRKKYEIIVINDGSSDKTDYALSQFSGPNDSVMRVLSNTSNIGLPASLNRGIRHAAGRYIVRVDSDDFVNTNFLSFLHYYLESNELAGAVACDYILIDDQERVIRRCCSKAEPIACGIMFRKGLLLEVGLYDEQFRAHEDKDLMYRFEGSYQVDHLCLPLYRYRRHENNLTNDRDVLDRHALLLAEKHGDCIEI